MRAKVLLDTNILLALEDDHVVASDFASFSSKCHTYEIGVFVHNASQKDVARDKNAARREKTLSKIKKFQIIEDPFTPSEEELSRRFGGIKKHNDLIDCILLHALEAGIVDFLVTEDLELHKRADRADLGDRLFRMSDALAWLMRTFEPRQVPLAFVEDRLCYQLNLKDPIFSSLRSDYSEFDEWFQKCVMAHRKCWVVNVDGQIAGLVIWKEEDGQESGIGRPDDRVLKLCTFKVGDNFRGLKLGEQLLKKSIWYAFKNTYSHIYLTAFDKQDFLAYLVGRYGFSTTGQNTRGELVYSKKMLYSRPESRPRDPLEFHLLNYPIFYDGPASNKYVVPIVPDFHSRLFPEANFRLQSELFTNSQEKFGAGIIPGNTIRKVYICHSKCRSLKPGDIILFYASRDRDYRISQSLATVGIVERTSITSNFGELVKLTAKRSVYTEDELRRMSSKETLVIDFTVSGHYKPPVKLKDAMSNHVLRSHPQSIASIDHRRYGILTTLSSVDLSPWT